MNTTLLIMAVGIGSRFGTGIKQLEPVDDSNHIIMDYFDIQLQPFEELEKAMKWWKSYNMIKHDRLGNISEANLENVLSALAALFLLERHLLSILIDDNTYVLLKPSSIFKIEGVDIQPKMSWIAKKDGGMALIYDDEE